MRIVVVCGDFIPRDHVKEEVKGVIFTDDFRYIVPLKCLTLLSFCVESSLVCDLCDEQAASKRKQDGCLRRDHSDILVRLHDLLYSCKGQKLLLEIVQVF